MMIKSRFTTSLLAILSALCMTSCIETPQVKSFIRPVKVTKVESLSHITRSYTGTVRSDQVSDLAFKMPGQVVVLAIEEGQFIKKGQLIAKIDPTDYTLQLQSAMANFKNTESQMERYKNLRAKDAISQQQFEAMEAAYVRDQAALDNAKNMLAETKIYAPFSGVVVKKHIENFQRVQAMQSVVKIIDPTNIEISFTLPESNIRYMNLPNKALSVKFDEVPDMRFKARLNKFVDVSIDGSGAPVTVVIDDKNFGQYRSLIRPGFACSVELTIDDESQKGCYILPTTAIYNKASGDGDGVWVFNPTTSTVQLRKVITGELIGVDNVVVKSGLQGDETVVSAGTSLLVDGQKVKLLIE